MNRIYNYGDFHVFERQQFEDYLNAFVENGYHIQIKKGNIYTEKNLSKVYYRVALAPKKSKKEELQKLIDFFEESGYRYIGQYGWFCIFESLEDTPVYSDDFIEEELIQKAVRRDLKGNVFYFIVIMLLIFIPYTTKTIFLSNNRIFGNVYAILAILFLFFSNLYFYGLYFKGKERNYSYQLCLARGFFFKYFSLMIICGSEFLFGTQNLCIAFITSFSFIISGFIIYLISLHKNWVNHYAALTIIFSLTVLFGVICGHSYKTSIPKLPLSMESYIMADKEENVFMNYFVFTNDNQLIEYIDLSYEMTGQYYLDRLINEDSIVSTKKINDYKVYESKDYTYIMKNKNIVKTNAIDNIDEFVKGLNW